MQNIGVARSADLRLAVIRWAIREPQVLGSGPEPGFSVRRIGQLLVSTGRETCVGIGRGGRRKPQAQLTK